MQPAFRNIFKAPPGISTRDKPTYVGLTKEDIPLVKEEVLGILKWYVSNTLDEPNLYFSISHVEEELIKKHGSCIYSARESVIKPAIKELVDDCRVEQVDIFVRNNHENVRRPAYRPSKDIVEILRYNTPFDEKLKELGVPDRHSILIMVGEKYGYNLMTTEESVSLVGQGKNTNWFYSELKRRYEERRKIIFSK